LPIPAETDVFVRLQTSSRHYYAYSRVAIGIGLYEAEADCISMRLG